jgi:hypothetical protein
VLQKARSGGQGLTRFRFVAIAAARPKGGRQTTPGTAGRGRDSRFRVPG